MNNKPKNTNWFFFNSNSSSSSGIMKEKEKLDQNKKVKFRDEGYVIDLCDQFLNLKASRQHKFEILVGDTGRKMPVVAYYPELKLVVEYRERQHTEAVKHFDKPDVMTISGVSRGEQRKIYDQRRREFLSKHGINLVEFEYSNFKFDSNKRIIRQDSDINIIKNILKDYL